jgi:DNA-binding NarL/FixJ family response regulator
VFRGKGEQVQIDVMEPGRRVERSVRTVIVSDEPLFSGGLKLLLEAVGHDPVFELDDLGRAGRFCTGERPEWQVVLWVLECFDRKALAAARAFRQSAPMTGLAILAQEVDLDVAQTLLVERGDGFGLLLRHRHPDIQLLSATLNQVARGSAAIEPLILKRLVTDAQENRVLESLTAMEELVLEMMASGLRNREIARRTHRSEKAIEKQVTRLFSKLGLDARVDERIDRRVTAARLYYTSRNRVLMPPTPERQLAQA